MPFAPLTGSKVHIAEVQNHLHYLSNKGTLNGVEIGDDGLLDLLKRLNKWMDKHGYAPRALPELPAVIKPKMDKKDKGRTEKEDMKKFQEQVVQTLATSQQGLESKFTQVLEKLVPQR